MSRPAKKAFYFIIYNIIFNKNIVLHALALRVIAESQFSLISQFIIRIFA